MTDYKHYREIARQCCLGVAESLFYIALSFLVGLIFLFFIMPIDDCDKSKFDRCGMKVVTDNKTGKQYLLSPYGGIIERESK